jgi:hypothetical protein
MGFLREVIVITRLLRGGTACPELDSGTKQSALIFLEFGIDCFNVSFSSSCSFFFFACPKKKQKKTSENGYTAFSDLGFNLAFALLW